MEAGQGQGRVQMKAKVRGDEEGGGNQREWVGRREGEPSMKPKDANSEATQVPRPPRLLLCEGCLLWSCILGWNPGSWRTL